jgi:hypothetical protein
MASKAAKPHPLDSILAGTVTPPPTRRKPRASEPPPRTSEPRTSKPSRRVASVEVPEPSADAEDVGSWNATHTRVTFHCPNAVLDLIYADVKARRKGLSPRERRAFGRTRVIVEILARHYGVNLSS